MQISVGSGPVPRISLCGLKWTFVQFGTNGCACIAPVSAVSMPNSSSRVPAQAVQVEFWPSCTGPWAEVWTGKAGIGRGKPATTVL